MTKLTGQCLCGAIAFEADGEVPVMANCHCTDCRKATGSAYAALMFMKEGDVKITGTTKTFQHNSDAGSTMTKHFCENCGSPMFTQNSNRPGMIGLRAGTINEQQEFTPKANVYTSSVMAATILDETLPAFPKMPG